MPLLTAQVQRHKDFDESVAAFDSVANDLEVSWTPTETLDLNDATLTSLLDRVEV